jgi:hypothetical protein
MCRPKMIEAAYGSKNKTRQKRIFY